MNKIKVISSAIHRTLNLDNCKKQKIFLIPYSTQDMLSNDTPTTLNDDYFDRPKLTEQNNPFEYIVPPALKWVGTKNSQKTQSVKPRWIIPNNEKDKKSYIEISTLYGVSNDNDQNFLVLSQYVLDVALESRTTKKNELSPQFSKD